MLVLRLTATAVDGVELAQGHELRAGMSAGGGRGRRYAGPVEKRYLFTPGPTPVPPAVLAAGAEPIVHHRGPDFREVYASTLDRLKDVFRTSSDVLLFTASGTGAMESAVANLCSPGERVAVVSHGSFGERWIAICEQYGLDVHSLRYEWGEVPDPDEVGAAVRESGAEIVLCQQSDTSTGVVSDVRAIKEAVGDALLVVDGISSLGAVPLETEAWGIDVVVSGSQKALMCPPGLAMASVTAACLGARRGVAELLFRLAAGRRRPRTASTRPSHRPSR